MTEMEEIWKLVENESGSSSSTSVDATGSESAASSSGGRRLPSIALESHLSPRHTSSAKNTDDSAVFDDFDGSTGRRRAAQNGHARHAGLDISQLDEVLRKEDRVPLQSTPKRPGVAALAAPDVSLLSSGGPKPSPVTRKGMTEIVFTAP